MASEINAAPRHAKQLFLWPTTEVSGQEFAALAREYGLPPRTGFLNLLDVRYAHLKTDDGGDLYLTRFGLPFWEHLQPENWYAREWFKAKRERLIGTSTIYKVPTKPVRDKILQLVVKWSRVGEDVPVDTLTINKFINAEFNSPFEEFALVMELRYGAFGPPEIRIRTQKPLAIYVPSERLQLWQTGRSESRIAAKLAKAPGVELDILRQYVLLYGWIKGYDLVETADLLGMQGEARDRFLEDTTQHVVKELESKGYRVIDMKPAHVIVRPQPDGQLLRDRRGRLAYAVVDYELMERTEEHEQAVRSVHRRHYLQHMAHRFQILVPSALPEHLKATNLLGVDYIFGHAESTGGLLWVVGRDPDLFNYFLPERWRRTLKRPLSKSHEVFYTCTKDNIHLVWKVSRLGTVPAPPPGHPRAKDMIEHGFNSPFEEFAFALEMGQHGMQTVYPRAIYMTGHKIANEREIADLRRFQNLSHLTTPEGEPALRPDHNYITIWGFYNGPDEVLAARDGLFYRGVDAEQAAEQGLLTQDALAELMERAQRRMARCGFEDLNFKPDHLLISFDPEDRLVHDTMGKPEMRLCNFELVRRLPEPLQELETSVQTKTTA